MANKLRIYLKAYDHMLLDQSAKENSGSCRKIWS